MIASTICLFMLWLLHGWTELYMTFHFSAIIIYMLCKVRKKDWKVSEIIFVKMFFRLHFFWKSKYSPTYDIGIYNADIYFCHKCLWIYHVHSSIGMKGQNLEDGRGYIVQWGGDKSIELPNQHDWCRDQPCAAQRLLDLSWGHLLFFHWTVVSLPCNVEKI